MKEADRGFFRVGSTAKNIAAMPESDPQFFAQLCGNTLVG